MQIRIKPELVASSCGFDFVGRPHDSNEVYKTLAALMTRQWSLSTTKQTGMFVYWKEKHRRMTKVVPLLTKSGNLSKKTIIKRIPTHWRYKIWFIPDTVVNLLRMDNKIIVQHKHHWSIESTKP